MRTFFPEIEARKTGFLQADEVHQIYWEESGNPSGTPILFLHGGPGSGTEPKHRRYFDPEKYRIILTDQRGCGKSTPHASLEKNTTPHLVSDLEKLRAHLSIERWTLFGGSWGSTLALAYAISHPDRIERLILRGIFLGTQQEFDWLYQHGASEIFPDRWEQFVSPIPREERENMMAAYYKRLTSPDAAVRHAAARSWSLWEASLLKIVLDPAMLTLAEDPAWAAAHARIECHYFMNDCFFPTPNYLIENISKIAHIPAHIIHGRYDMICPLSSAWKLHRAWPRSTLEIVPLAGHSGSEPSLVDALIRATI
jgi:proline iminopeptidase